MRIKVTLAMAVAAAASIWAQNSTPWTPPKRTAYITTTYVFDTFREYRRGPTPDRLAGNLDQRSLFANIEYGVTRRLSADIQFGHTQTSFLSNGLSGATGARYKAISTEHQVVTLRAAGIIAGSYPLTNLGPFAPGFKAHGFLGSALYGVTLPKRVYASLEFGYNKFQMPVRDRVFGNVVVGQSIGRWSYFGGYQQSRGLSGWDLLSKGFTPVRRNQTKRIYGGYDIGGGYTLPKDIYLGFTYGRFLHGRNVGVKSAMAVTLGFQLPMRK
jgi:hypothetical protein